MVGSLCFVFLDLSIGEILNFAVGGDSATRIDSNIDCLSTGGVGSVGWVAGGVVSHTESFKVAQFCLYPRPHNRHHSREGGG